jgi:phosphoribosylpyrophosphate synthetase
VRQSIRENHKVDTVTVSFNLLTKNLLEVYAFYCLLTFPTADNLMEMLLMIDAAKRASARHITAVIPYFLGDKIEKTSQGSDRAKLVANLLDAAGATRVMTMDLHADQIQGFFEKPVDHLCFNYLLPYVKSLLDNLTIASPDMGGSKEPMRILNFRVRCNLLQTKKRSQHY